MDGSHTTKPREVEEPRANSAGAGTSRSSSTELEKRSTSSCLVIPYSEIGLNVSFFLC